MNKRLFPRMAFCLTLITSFLFMPFTAVYADGLTQDSEYWKWWYIQNTTNAITDGDGASADNITDTYNGSTVEQYVYDQTGLTAEDVKDYVKHQYNNAKGYVEHTAEWYSSAIDDIWNSSIDAGTKAKYQAEKALRETVDAAGNTVVNVSSSDYWSNVYNDLFNSSSYNTIYDDNGSKTVSGESNGKVYSIEYIGRGRCTQQGTDTLLSQTWNKYYTYEIYGEGKTSGFPMFRIVYNGETYYKYYPNDTMGEIVDIEINANTVGYYFQFRIKDSNENYWSGGWDFLNGSTEPTIDKGQGTPQDEQVGFVYHNGIKYPVYKDTTKNPFKINDNGTVTWNDGSGEEPIYVDPSQLTDDGFLDILEWLDNDDLTQNPYNPQGQPWNTQSDGSVLGGFFSNLVKDISSIFDGIGKMISDLIDKIIKAIKDIANIIVDALKSFWNLLIGDIEEYPNLFQTDVNDNFDMISDLYDLLLECMGVDA